MDFIGKITNRLEVKSGTSKSSGKAWKSVDYVIEETEGQYPKKMCFSVFGEEKVNNALVALKKGTMATISFDINCNEYQGRWYNTIKAYKVIVNGVDVLSGNVAEVPQSITPATPTTDVSQQAQQVDAFPEGNGNGGGDDLPF